MGTQGSILGVSISSHEVAESTIIWPEPYYSTASRNTTVEEPTTFFVGVNSNCDWRGEEFNIWGRHDPCPPGWRLPSSGDYNIWKIASGDDSLQLTESNGGVNFSAEFGWDSSIWYPASCCRTCEYESWWDGNYWRGQATLNLSESGIYWTKDADSDGGYGMRFYSDLQLICKYTISCSNGGFVRCQLNK